MKNIKKILKKWYISYNHYSDLFQMYDYLAFTMPKDQREEHTNDNIKIIINKDTSQPILIEIRRAYDTLHADIDKLDKTDIINLVEPYFYKYE